MATKWEALPPPVAEQPNLNGTWNAHLPAADSGNTSTGTGPPAQSGGESTANSKWVALPPRQTAT